MEDYDRLEINRWAYYHVARRELAGRYHVEGLTYRAIAQRIGLTVGGARQMVKAYKYQTLQPLVGVVPYGRY
jgi:transposase